MSNSQSSATWKKSRFCDSGSCVEVASIGEEIAVRDSKDPDGPILRFSKEEWTAFARGVAEGDFHFS